VALYLMQCCCFLALGAFFRHYE